MPGLHSQDFLIQMVFYSALIEISVASMLFLLYKYLIFPQCFVGASCRVHASHLWSIRAPIRITIQQTDNSYHRSELQVLYLPTLRVQIALQKCLQR